MPFWYLGIPLAAEKLKVIHYSSFINKIASYINTGTSAALSYAGRAELIRSVLQRVECFWLLIFPILAAVRDRIVRLCRNFLWNSKHPNISWTECLLCKNFLWISRYIRLELLAFGEIFVGHSFKERYALGLMGQSHLLAITIVMAMGYPPRLIPIAKPTISRSG